MSKTKQSSGKKGKGKKIKTVFQAHYKTMFDWIDSDPHDVHAAFCKACRCSIKVGHEGLTALKAHGGCEKHKKKAVDFLSLFLPSLLDFSKTVSAGQVGTVTLYIHFSKR